MDFVKSHFGKMQLWPVEHFFHHKKVPVEQLLYKIQILRGKPKKNQNSNEVKNGCTPSTVRIDSYHHERSL